LEGLFDQQCDACDNAWDRHYSKDVFKTEVLPGQLGDQKRTRYAAEPANA